MLDAKSLLDMKHECSHMIVQMKTYCNASVLYEDANANVYACNVYACDA